VSKKAHVSKAHPDAEALAATLAVIDSVHDDGRLSEVKILPSRGARVAGEIVISKKTNKVLKMFVSVDGPHPELTLIQLVAHWIHQELFGSPTLRDTFMKLYSIHMALYNSESGKATRKIFRTRRSSPTSCRDVTWGDHFDLQGLECFSQAYTQWIVQKSGHPRLKAQWEQFNSIWWGVAAFDEKTMAKFDKHITKFFQKESWNVTPAS
jgi:hypothetical protein